VALFIALLALAGCTYSVDQTGDDTFLRGEIEWKIGETTSADVAQALGPPDRISVWNDHLWFVYAFNHVSTSNLELAWNSLAFFQRNARDEINRTLIVSFDERDRLLYHAMSRAPIDRALLGVDY
jgi:hypothetical protein